MCHVSVGHIARALESAGTPTVVIMVEQFKHIAEQMRVPRVLYTKHPLGRPMGAAGDSATHAGVLNDALRLLGTATTPTRITRPGTFKPGQMT